MIRIVDRRCSRTHVAQTIAVMENLRRRDGTTERRLDVTMTAPAPIGIFIVDDLSSMRERLREFLCEIEGVEVVGDAATTDAAIAGILGARPDCVVLDYQLADGTGVKVLHVVRATAPEIVFIVLTNHATPQHRAVCLAAGARYFFDKSTEFGKIPLAIAEIGAWLH